MTDHDRVDVLLLLLTTISSIEYISIFDGSVCDTFHIHQVTDEGLYSLFFFSFHSVLRRRILFITSRSIVFREFIISIMR